MIFEKICEMALRKEKLKMCKNAAKKKLPKFNNETLDYAVERMTVDVERDKKLLENQVACTISKDEQIGRLVLSHLEGRNEAKLEAAEAFLREGDKRDCGFLFIFEMLSRELGCILKFAENPAEKSAAGTLLKIRE